MSSKIHYLYPKTRYTENNRQSVMVRDLDGRIYYWNADAEQKYGWNHRRAIGNVSHNLLHTVFPQPLDLINFELLNRGIWTGELIHTRADGVRVKVKSTWHLYRDDDGRLCTVLEVNDNFLHVDPQTAHLDPFQGLRSIARRGLLLLNAYKWWIVGPALLALAVFTAVVMATPNHHLPLIQ
jgi:PAS domain S-box-containing protein